MDADVCTTLKSIDSTAQGTYVASVVYDLTADSTSAGMITATSQGTLGTYTYILSAALSTSGQVTWSQAGTCEAEGLCD